MLSGGVESLFNDADGSVASVEVGLLTTLGTAFMDDLVSTDNEYQYVIFRKTPESINEPIKARGRLTPSVLRSRRIKQFIVG